MEIRFTVHAIPIAQPRQRHRVVSSRGKHFATNYTPKSDPVNTFKAAVQLTASQVYKSAPLEGPIGMDVILVFPRPKTVAKKLGDCRLPHDVKPDRDNVYKALSDAMNGLIYRDDSQICDGRIVKCRAAADEQPHVEVTIWEIE